MAENVVNLLDDDIAGRYLTDLAGILSTTMGPYGRTSIIEHQLGQHEITKDGYTVLKALFEKDAEKRILLDLIKRVSRRLVSVVGDGSTSAVVVSAHLHSVLGKVFNNNSDVPPQDILTTLQVIGEAIINQIKERATPIKTTDDLYHIVHVATNGNTEVAKMIVDIYGQIGRDGVIRHRLAQGTKTYFDVSAGMETFRGLLDPIYADDFSETGYSCTIKNANVLMCDGMLTVADYPGLIALMEDIIDPAKPDFTNLVVYAAGFDKTVRDFFKENREKFRDVFSLALIEVSLETQEQSKRFDDLAVYIGATPYYKVARNQVEGISREALGTVEELSSTEKITRFIGGGGSVKDVAERVASIKKSVSDLEQTGSATTDIGPRIRALNSRIADISKSVATIYIGGDTEQAKTTKDFLVEDAIFSCRSALRSGIVLGGNTAVPKAIYQLLSSTDSISAISVEVDKRVSTVGKCLIEEILASVSSAYASTFNDVLRNAATDAASVDMGMIVEIGSMMYDVRRKEYVALDPDRLGEDGCCVIINSAETDIEILRSAFSIIGLIASSSQIVTVPR